MYILWQSYQAGYVSTCGKLSFETATFGDAQYRGAPNVTVKAGNLGRWLPPWTVTRDMCHVALKATVSGVSTDALLFSWCGTPLVHCYGVFGG